MITSLITYTLLLSPLINPINFVRITLKRAKTHCTTVTISHIHIQPSSVLCLSGHILLYLRFNPTNFGHNKSSRQALISSTLNCNVYTFIQTSNNVCPLPACSFIHTYYFTYVVATLQAHRNYIKVKTKHTSCGQDLRDHTFKYLLSLFTHNISPEGLLIPCYFHLCSCNPTNFAYKTYIPKACPKQSRAETTRYNIESTAFNLLIIYLLFIIQQQPYKFS